ncbi:hypothetical protein BVY04_01380, partial [bacterium M21]
LRLSKLKLQNHPVLQAAAISGVDFADWRSLETTATYRSQGQTRNVQVSAGLKGVRGDDFMANSPADVQLAFRAEQNRTKGVLTVSSVKLQARSGSSDKGATASFTVMLGEELKLSMSGDGGMYPLNKGAVTIAGELSQQWLATQLQPEKTHALTESVTLNGTLNLTPGQELTAAHLRLQGEVPQGRWLDLNLHSTLGRGWKPQATKLQGSWTNHGSLKKAIESLEWLPFEKGDVTLAGNGQDWKLAIALDEAQLPVVNGTFVGPVRLHSTVRVDTAAKAQLELQKVSIAIGQGLDELKAQLAKPITVESIHSLWPVGSRPAIFNVTGTLQEKWLGVRQRNLSVSVASTVQ